MRFMRYDFKPDDRIHGFKVKSVRDIEELGAVLCEFEYEKNGAKLLWLSREDSNKTFSVTFKTIPEDDTGVFHILEHSVLGGSRKYPVKEPFVELLKGSLQTFLNAFTFPDKTMYPVCSRNDKDFLNLADVYMDAVLHPTIYDKPETFWQEGWHYEMFSPEEELSRNGVVYNEMQGAFSSVETIINSKLNRLLFPDNCYKFESGGEPSSIPELTYEQFLAAHRRYYHPSNAWFFLDGDINMEEILALIDGYISPYDYQHIDAETPMQQPTGFSECRCEYEASEEDDLSGKVQFATGYVFADFSEQKKSLAMDILTDVLCGSNEAPLKKAILEKGLADDVCFSTIGMQQIMAVLVVRNTSEDKLGEIKQTVREVLTELAKKGIDRALITASFNNLEFVVKERDYGSMPAGLGFAMSVFDSWLYNGDPAQNLSYNESFDFLREQFDKGYFEQLIKEELLESKHKASVVLIPSASAGEERRKKEERELRLIRKDWSEEVVKKVISMNERLRAVQEAADLPENLAKLPSVSIDDIPKEPEELPLKASKYGDVNVLLHEIAAGGLVYADMYFSAADLSLEELSLAALFCEVLTQTATENLTGLELMNEIKTNLGFLSVTPAVYSKPGQTEECNPYICVGCGLLEERKGDAVRLIKEVLLGSKFADTKLIRNIIGQRKLGIERSVVSSGTSYASRRVGAASSAQGVAADAIAGLTFYRNLRKIEKEFEKNPESLCEKFATLLKRIFVKQRLTVSVTGSSNEAFASSLADVLPDSDNSYDVMIPSTARYAHFDVKQEGVSIPASVAFVAKGANIYNLGEEYTGHIKVASSLLSLGYLWNAIRVQGGAYGAGMSASINGNICFTSYRDPNASDSLESFDGAGAALREFCESEEDLTKHIIGTIADTEPVLSNKLKGRNAAVLWLSGIEYETRVKTRCEILQTTKQDLIEVSKLLDRICGVNNVCVIGEKSKLEACGDKLSEIVSVKG